MTRYQSAEWARLVDAQNTMALSGSQQDILTITGFMAHSEFLAHVTRYAPLADGIGGTTDGQQPTGAGSRDDESDSSHI